MNSPPVSLLGLGRVGGAAPGAAPAGRGLGGAAGPGTERTWARRVSRRGATCQTSSRVVKPSAALAMPSSCRVRMPCCRAAFRIRVHGQHTMSAYGDLTPSRATLEPTPPESKKSVRVFSEKAYGYMSLSVPMILAGRLGGSHP